MTFETRAREDRPNVAVELSPRRRGLRRAGQTTRRKEENTQAELARRQRRVSGWVHSQSDTSLNDASGGRHQ
jgi:hypothetical protein